jgi:hypothetical protein
MMITMNLAYEKLRDALPRGGTQMVKCDELYHLLQWLFSEEKAALACRIPPTAFTTGDLATLTLENGLNEVVKLLECMASHGLISTRKKGNEKYYIPQPLLPGLSEYAFMSGR